MGVTGSLSSWNSEFQSQKGYNAEIEEDTQSRLYAFYMHTQASVHAHTSAHIYHMYTCTNFIKGWKQPLSVFPIEGDYLLLTNQQLVSYKSTVETSYSCACHTQCYHVAMKPMLTGIQGRTIWLQLPWGLAGGYECFVARARGERGQAVGNSR